MPAPERLLIYYLIVWVSYGWSASAAVGCRACR